MSSNAIWSSEDTLPMKGLEDFDRENADHRPGLPISGGVLAVVVASAFLMLRPEPFRPSRPTIADPQTGSEETVRARLWEDPFAAVARHAGKDGLPSGGLEPGKRENTLRNVFGNPPGSATDGTEVRAVGVMVSAGPYDEQAERRLRSRYAALSALGVLGFEPEDSDHVGYFTLGDEIFQPDSTPKAGRAAALVVPFEWFSGPERERLLLLWLDEDAFRSAPLAKVGRLAGELKRASPGIELKLLGPYGSTNLKAMAEELEGYRRREGERACHAEQGPDGPDGPREALANVQIYSPSATIADDLLPQSPDDCGPCPGTAETRSAAESLDCRFRRWTGSDSSRFLRTIGTDRDLARELLAELERRGVEPGRESEPSHVALVSEWDTHYGRALPCAFIGAVTDDKYPAWCRPGSSDSEPENIHRFSYLRGLDGQLPATTGAERMEQDPAAQSKPSDQETVERPYGRRRLDYLRRLAGQLRRLDSTLDGKGLEAIGVLGSDVYDKLLVLQALREKFPHVILFTTDLDASLLHPAEYRSAKNLVVVSNFGLELEKTLQRHVPAFRDNYQTSLFFSMRLALGQELREPGQDFVDHLMKPRVFEIGRSGAFDLSEDPGEIHPPRTDLLSRPVTEWLWKPFVPAVLMLGFLLLCRRTYQDMKPAAGRLAVRLTRARAHLGLILLAGMLAMGVLISIQKLDGEPFALFEGISVWPSLFLRFFVGAFSIYFLMAGWIAIAESDSELVRKFLRPSEERTPPSMRKSLNTCRALWRCARRRLRRLFRAPAGAHRRAASGGASAPTTTASAVLLTYVHRSRLARRILRVFPLWTLYFVIGFFVVRVFGAPNVPFRGHVSQFASKAVTLGFAVPLLTFLILWVVDATVLSVWLTKALANCKMEWPEKTKDYFAHELDLGRDLLEEWLDIQVIARQSVAVGRLVYYPAIAMILMIASRAPYFDSWDFPVGLCIAISISLTYLIFCAVALRRAAERARSVAGERYGRLLIQSAGDPSKAEKLGQIRDWIRNLSVGAFVPIRQQPWVRAVALLFGGGGSLVFLEYFVWLN